jgi:hypothetical protein
VIREAKTIEQARRAVRSLNEGDRASFCGVEEQFAEGAGVKRGVYGALILEDPWGNSIGEIGLEGAAEKLFRSRFYSLRLAGK